MKSLRKEVESGGSMRIEEKRETTKKALKEDFVEETFLTRVQGTYDVIVVGGGTAGCVAALAAARNSAKVLVVEKHTFLGGTLLGGAICYMGLFNVYKPYPDRERTQLVRGIPNEIVQRITRDSGSPGIYEEVLNITYDSASFSWDRDVLPETLLKMFEENGVDVVFGAEFKDAIMEGNTVKGVIWNDKSGRHAAYAKVVVDCSGIAEVASKTTATCGTMADRQTGGMSLGMANVDQEKLREYASSLDAIRLLSYSVKDGKNDFITRFTLDLRKLPAFKDVIREYNFMDSPCMIANERGSFNMINAVTTHFDTTDPDERTKARISLTKSCLKLADMLRKNVPGFENAVLDWISPEIGIRFGRWVDCEYDITREDVAENRMPDDVIGVYGVQDAVLAQGDECRIEGGWYGVPYRALIPKNVENLLVAGEMVASDWLVWMSIRLTGGCMLMGQAAGTAAALAAKSDITPRELPYDSLREALLKDNAFLG